MATFEALRIPNFRLLWAGVGFSSVANWIMMTTMGWVVYDLTGSGALTGGINAVRIIPGLLVPPLAGLASDYLSRRGVINWSQTVAFGATFGMALLLMFDRAKVWHLFVVMVAANAADSFSMPARQTLVYDVVPRRLLANAMALSNLAFSVSRTFGPMLAGVLIVLFGASGNFLMQGAACLFVILTVLRMRLPNVSTAPRREHSFLREMAEGYRFVFKDPIARSLVLLNIVNPLFLIPTHIGLLPIFAKDVFQGDAATLGIMLSAIGFGGLFGGLLTASLSRADRRGLIQVTAMLIYSVAQTSFIAVAGITGDLAMAVPLLVIAGAAESVFLATNVTLVQLHAPDRMRGRIVSVLQLSYVMMPIGTFSAGLLADFYPAAWVGGLYGSAAVVITLGFLLFAGQMRRMRLSRYVHAEEVV